MTDVNPTNRYSLTAKSTLQDVCWLAQRSGIIAGPCSTTTNREAAPREGRSVDHRLARLLDTPLLARVVPHLSAGDAVTQLVQYRGLDACGELVTCRNARAATSPASTSICGASATAGSTTNSSEGDRFGEWLELLVDTGDSAAARTSLPSTRDRVIAGLSRYLRVFAPGTFEPVAQS